MKDDNVDALFLDPKEVQKLLGIGATKFYELVKLTDFPKPRKNEFFKRPRFLRNEIINWAANLPVDDNYFNDEE